MGLRVQVSGFREQRPKTKAARPHHYSPRKRTTEKGQLEEAAGSGSSSLRATSGFLWFMLEGWFRAKIGKIRVLQPCL